MYYKVTGKDALWCAYSQAVLGKYINFFSELKFLVNTNYYSGEPGKSRMYLH